MLLCNALDNHTLLRLSNSIRRCCFVISKRKNPKHSLCEWVPLSIDSARKQAYRSALIIRLQYHIRFRRLFFCAALSASSSATVCCVWRVRCSVVCLSFFRRFFPSFSFVIDFFFCFTATAFALLLCAVLRAYNIFHFSSTARYIAKVAIVYYFAVARLLRNVCKASVWSLMMLR